MILHQTQSVVAQDKHRFRVVNCGRRWGKTTLAILEMVAKGIFKDGSRIAYIAPTIQQARDIAWAELKRVCNPIIVKSKEAPSLEIVIQTKNGKESTIFLRGWENVETLRGQYFDFIVIDEIASMRNFQLNWEEVIRPTLTDRKGEVLFISTPKGFNHFYDLFNFNDPDYKSFHFTSYDNPHLPVEELDKAKKEIPADRFAQEYMADFRKSEGLVYKEFSRDLHVYETAPKFEKKGYYGGIDFGFTNPCAVIHCNVTKDDHYYISEEWYKTGRTEEQVGDYVKTCGFNGVAPDPESPSAIEVLNQKGLNVIEVVKGKDSIKSGIDLIRGLFKSNRIHIHRNCINLIQELETYSYPPKTTNHNEPEVPIKENDHACFMAGTIVNGKRIEDIGYQTGVEDVFEYEIAGEKIIATPNHPVITHRGLANIDTLRYNDIIWKKKLLFTQVVNGIDTLRVLTGLKGITLAVVKRIKEASQRDYIDLSGKKLTELSLKDFVCITLMATPIIIYYQILLLLTAVNTLVTIGLRKSENGLAKMCLKLLRVLPIGLRPSRVRFFVLSWVRKMLNTFLDILSKGGVIYVTKNTSVKQISVGSVISIAVPKRFVGHEPVYNVRMKSGMYLANGIMVSNCDSLRYLITALQRTQVKSFVAQKQDEQWSMRRNQIASNSTK